MLSSRKNLLRWAASFLLVVLAGCSGGSGPKVVKVTGSLKYKGQPVTNALIQFEPENGRPSWAQTDEEGRFKVNYDREQDGAVVGKHKVHVKMRPSTAADQEAVMMGKKPVMSKEMTEFFDKYGAGKSTVQITIDKNTSELPLDWD
jgi:hypothetical protein